jgi:hypothetical protein
MLEELGLAGGEKVAKRAGILPFLALAPGALVVFITHRLARY